MSYHDVVIIGGGLGGVAIAAFHLSRGKTVAIIEPGQLVGAYSAGGLKYVRDSAGFRRLLADIGLEFMVVPVVGGVMHPATREILPYPGDLGGEYLETVQRVHYLKTRGTMDGFTYGVMNFGGGGNRLLFDMSSLVEYVSNSARVVDQAARRVSGRMVSAGGWLEGGEVVSTAPLPILCRLLGLDASESPMCGHETLVTAQIDTLAGGAAADFPFDYVYTPWLDVVHRISKRDDHLEVEWNKRLGDGRDDVLSLGMDFETKPQTQPGHLHPAVWGSVRPDAGLFRGVRLAGRFAEWDPRRTVDQTVDQLYGL